MDKCIRCKNKPAVRGYGRRQVGGKLVYEHRLAYQKANPAENITGKIIHHICDNRWCINPKHLRSVTQKEHSAAHGLAGIAKIHSEKTHGKCGHLFDKFNGRQRYCSVCLREYKRKWASDHYEERKDHINFLKRKWRKSNKLKKIK